MDNIRLEGILNIKEYCKGKLISNNTYHNIITTLGLSAYLGAIAGDANCSISKAQIGTNATAEATTDKIITNPLDLQITHKIENGLVITFNIDENTANGMTISELGLLTSSGILTNRKAITPMVKDSAKSFICTWTIKD